MALRRPGELTRFLVFLLVLLFGPATVRCALAPIRVSLPLTVGFAPLTLSVTIVIPRDDNNREACVSVNLQEEVDRSCWTVNGAREGVEFHRTFRRLSPGTYAVTAWLRRSDGFVYARPAKLVVYGE